MLLDCTTLPRLDDSCRQPHRTTLARPYAKELPRMSDDVTSFRIDIPDTDLDDLRDRLRRTRWPEAETVDDWSQGVRWATSKSCVGTGPTGTTGGPPRRGSTPCPSSGRRSTGSAFTSSMRGHRIRTRCAGHHARLARLDRRVREGDRSTDRPDGTRRRRSDAFHVVCPSLPGYGFSDKPARSGWTSSASQAPGRC